MVFMRTVFRFSFQWMLIAGLLLAVKSLTNAPDELKNSEGGLLSARLGLLDVPQARTAASEHTQ